MNQIFCSLRITCPNSIQLHSWYILNFNKWLSHRGYKLINHTYGVHLNTEVAHFHYHLVIEGKKKLSNPLATLKQDFGYQTTQKLFEEYQSQCAANELPKSFIGQEYKSKINMSVQMKNVTDDAGKKRFLQYPLKEGNTDEKHNCLQGLPYDIIEIMSLSKAEYLASNLVREKKEKSEEKSKSEWSTLVEHISNKHPESIGQVFRETTLYYLDNWEKPPTFKFLSDQAERYCIKTGLLSIEFMESKFCSQH